MMEQNDFQKLLLETVICSIACDGDIDDREIAELHKMVAHAQYFKGIDGRDFMKIMLLSVKNDGRSFLVGYFNHLKNSDLQSPQELLVLEVILRIIHADERIDDNEIKFLKLVRSNLNVHDEIIHQRFGDVPYLTMGNYEQQISTEDTQCVNSIADMMDRVAEDKTRFNGFFVEALAESSELDLGERTR